jgi:hypothetical protein
MENLRQSSHRLLPRRRQKTPYLAQESLGMILNMTLENLPEVSASKDAIQGMPTDKKLEN